MPQRILTALPVYNEVKHVREVLAEVRRYSRDVLVVDDGSTDGTRELLAREPGIQLLTHEKNRGYGAALKSAFDYAVGNRYDVLVTIDCDSLALGMRTVLFDSCRSRLARQSISTR